MPTTTTRMASKKTEKAANLSPRMRGNNTGSWTTSQKRKRTEQDIIPTFLKETVVNQSGVFHIQQLANLSGLLQPILLGDGEVSTESSPDIVAARLLPNGDLILLSKQSVSITLRAIFESNPVSAIISLDNCNDTDPDNQFGAISTSDCNRQLFGCDTNGYATLTTVSKDGSGASLYGRLNLSNDQERVSFVLHTG